MPYNMKNISKTGLIKNGWEILKKEYKLIYSLVVAYFVYQIIQSIITSFFENGVVAIIISLSFTIITLFLQIGFIKIILKLVDNKKAKFQELWAYPQYLIRFTGASISYFLAVIIGLIFFVIPGIYIAIRLQFYSYILLDKDTKAMDSLRESWKLTHDNVINLTLFMLLIIGFNLLGLLLFGVGLLLTIPITFFAVTILYRKLDTSK